LKDGLGSGGAKGLSNARQRLPFWPPIFSRAPRPDSSEPQHTEAQGRPVGAELGYGQAGVGVGPPFPSSPPSVAAPPERNIPAR
jgi:hypothetical protein